MEIIGKEGRAELLREVAKGLDIPVDRIVPSREDLQQQAEQQAAMQQAQQQAQMQMQMQQQQAQQAAMHPPETTLDGAAVAGGHEASLF
jgi:transcription initiation factor TFIID subunit TAF12